MKINTLMKKRLFLFCVVLIIFSLFASNNITESSLKSFRIKRVEEMKNNINQKSNNYLNAAAGASGEDVNNFFDIQVFDDTILNDLFLFIKNLDMLFFNLIITLSFYQVILYIKRWMISVYPYRIKLFFLRCLHLKDGKKNDVSFYFSF